VYAFQNLISINAGDKILAEQLERIAINAWSRRQRTLLKLMLDHPDAPSHEMP